MRSSPVGRIPAKVLLEGLVPLLERQLKKGKRLGRRKGRGRSQRSMRLGWFIQPGGDASKGRRAGRRRTDSAPLFVGLVDFSVRTVSLV
jgi:hypothetical protein